jgi:hypothetical protein
MEIDPLAYWSEHHKGYPILARMARDTLSIPATGAGVERMFNYARDICHYRRGSLKDVIIGKLMMYMCTARFESAAELHQFACEIAGTKSLEVQISEDFEIESLISDSEEDGLDMEGDSGDEAKDGEREREAVPPSFAPGSPLNRIASSDESEIELPNPEIVMVRSSKRPRKGRDFYEGA